MKALYRFIPKGDTVHHEREWKQNQATGPTSRMKDRTANGPIYKTSKPTINDISSPISNHLLKGSRCPQTGTLPWDQVFKYMRLQGTFHMKPRHLGKRRNAAVSSLREWLELGQVGDRQATLMGCHRGPRANCLEGGANSALNKSLLNERMNESYHHSDFQKVKKSTLEELALSLLHAWPGVL